MCVYIYIYRGREGERGTHTHISMSNPALIYLSIWLKSDPPIGPIYKNLITSCWNPYQPIKTLLAESWKIAYIEIAAEYVKCST